ncbi:hypothetical protein GCM10011519_27260 [Marmoricola endophyticus]|uniref:Acyltransferase n=1 Tax=Marmoricola endophyticus TaxID=2040280 RepID=A0A917BPE8_9ACTN|nr:acyltransferase [Marmoricola endophyticus]GGF51784.1 hypothetical protein GCM10011519_27260 [Marmoricola endophyticus]
MSLARQVLSAPPALRWHRARLRMPLLRRAFGALGSGTVIVRPHALRGVDRIRVGRDCAIFEDAWLQAEDGSPGIDIGDRVYLGLGVHVHSIDAVRIGSGCVLADGVLVTSADHDRQDRHAVHGSGPVVIGDDVFLGQRAVVLGGVSVGDGATVGAHAVVTRDVPAGATVVGVPARVVGSPA